MKVLIYGSKNGGWIGTMFKNFLEKHNEQRRENDKEDIEVAEGLARCDNHDAVRKEILEQDATHVFCSVGRTSGRNADGTLINNIDYLEQPGKLVENMRDNLTAPLTLAKVCVELDVHLSYIGTGCIFTYDDIEKAFDHKFTEEDEPNFFGSSYSIVKGQTDVLMHRLFPEVLNLRIRMPISSEQNPKNFLTKISSYPKVLNAINSVTVLDTAFPFILSLMKHLESGTLNLCNPDPVSHKDILEMYREIVDPTHTVEYVSADVHNTSLVKARRSQNVMDSTHLVKLCTQYKFDGYVESSTKEQIRRIFNQWKSQQ